MQIAVGIEGGPGGSIIAAGGGGGFSGDGTSGDGAGGQSFAASPPLVGGSGGSFGFGTGGTGGAGGFGSGGGGRRRLQRQWRRQQWQRRRWWRVFPRPLRAGPVPCRGHQLRRRPGDDHRATGGRPGTSLAAAAERRPRRHRGSPPAPPALTAPDTSADANTSTSLCLRLRWKAGRTIKRPLGRFNPRRIQLPWTMAAPAAVAKSTRPGTG